MLCVVSSDVSYSCDIRTFIREERNLVLEFTIGTEWEELWKSRKKTAFSFIEIWVETTTVKCSREILSSGLDSIQELKQYKANYITSFILGMFTDHLVEATEMQDPQS
jgi:hypothetical protein